MSNLQLIKRLFNNLHFITDIRKIIPSKVITKKDVYKFSDLTDEQLGKILVAYKFILIECLDTKETFRKMNTKNHITYIALAMPESEIISKSKTIDKIAESIPAMNLMDLDQHIEIIIIAEDSPKSSTQKKIDSYTRSNEEGSVKFTWLLYHVLVLNIFDHIYVDEAYILSQEEQDELEEELAVSSECFPKIFAKDVIACLLGANIGDIICTKFVNKVSGDSLSYRYVI